MRGLEIAEWVRADDPARGKVVSRWTVNPRAHALFAARAQAERERREGETQRIREAIAAIKKLRDEL